VKEITMPKLGESVTEGTIEKWLVSPGDKVEEYDPLCEVITDKVTAEVPSVYDGVIGDLLVNEGDTVEVGTPICQIDAEGAASNDNNEEEAAEQETSEETVPSKQQPENSESKQSDNKKNARISPVVMRLASENDIELSKVDGSGFNGRITKKDILKVIEEGQNNTPSTKKETPKTQTSTQAQPQPSVSSGDEIPVNGVRAAIANNMVQSSQEIPHAWLMMEVDATNLVNVRNKYKSSFKENEGYNLTYFSFFVKAVAETLKEFPMLNSSWQGDKIVVNKDININIAVAGDDKLYVPVIRDADELTVKGIAKQVNELASLGRKHQLTSDHMQGGTFTVNNTGAFGSVQSMGIINQPQAAILQVESIVKRPVIIDDMIASRHMVNLCLSIDHRVLDGLAAGQFLKRIKERIEAMSVEHTSVY
jgi:2-oxoisovalerate dehydrogenase E2 component (dihydrolipoyl transacylase)